MGDLNWGKVKLIVHGIPNDLNKPRFAENYEVMVKKYTQWEKKNPPKL